MRAMIVALVCCLPPMTFAGEQEAVIECFEGYKAAILEQKGEVAAGLVTKRTLDEYQHYVDWALSADRGTIKSLSFINRFQVFLVRHRVPAATLRQLDGRSLFAYAVDQDWIGKNGVIRTTLASVDVASGRATSEVIIGGKKAPHRFQFTREEEAWKFDLIQVIRDMDQAFKALVQQKGWSEEEFMFSMIETVSGRKVDETIWNPLQTISP